VPRIKRWFPVSHDINRDPEIRELRRRHGDWAALAWLECLSIADRNGGKIPGTMSDVAEIIGQVSLQMYRKRATDGAQMVLRWAEDHGWITVRSAWIEVVNYTKYHRTEERNTVPSEPDRTRPNLLLKKEEKEPAPPEPSAGLKVEEKREPEKRSAMDPDVKVACDAVYRIDPQKFARLVVWVKQAEKAKFSNLVIAESLRAFLPYSKDVGESWWPYLDKLCYKADQRINVREHDREHAEKKREVREASLRLMG